MLLNSVTKKSVNPFEKCEDALYIRHSPGIIDVIRFCMLFSESLSVSCSIENRFFFCLSTSTMLRSIFSAMSCSQCIKMCLFCSSFAGYLPLNLFLRKSIVFISLSTHFGLLKIYCFISFSQRLQIISLQIGHSNYGNIKTISFSPGSTITFFSGWLPFHLVPIQ